MMKGKLVRDKIPEIIRTEGSVPYVRILSRTEFKQELRRKLQEEVREVMKSRTHKSRVVELSDVLEVFHALIDVYDISYTSVEKARRKKLKDKGGFSQRLFLKYPYS